MNVTKKQFQAFVEVQCSGITNMLDLQTVKALSGLEIEVIKEIINKYYQLHEKYNKG